MLLKSFTSFSPTYMIIIKIDKKLFLVHLRDWHILITEICEQRKYFDRLIIAFLPKTPTKSFNFSQKSLSININNKVYFVVIQQKKVV